MQHRVQECTEEPGMVNSAFHFAKHPLYLLHSNLHLYSFYEPGHYFINHNQIRDGLGSAITLLFYPLKGHWCSINSEQFHTQKSLKTSNKDLNPNKDGQDDMKPIISKKAIPIILFLSTVSICHICVFLHNL